MGKEITDMKSWIAAATLSIALVACGGHRTGSSADDQAKMNTPATTEQPASAQTMSPEQLGQLGAEIQKNPSKANEVLKDHGLDEKSFEHQIRQVTENPDASKRYAAAYRKARES